MADEASMEDDALPLPTKETTASQPKPALHILLRIVLGTAGLLLVVGFFLPWLQLPSESHTGLSLVLDADRDVREMVGDTQRWILPVIPLLGVALTAIGFLGFRWAGAVAASIGLLLMGYGFVTVVLLFFQRTGVGLWLIVLGALIALMAGVFGWVRARSAKQAGESDTATLPDDLEA